MRQVLFLLVASSYAWATCEGVDVREVGGEDSSQRNRSGGFLPSVGNGCRPTAIMLSFAVLQWEEGGCTASMVMPVDAETLCRSAAPPGQ